MKTFITGNEEINPFKAANAGLFDNLARNACAGNSVEDIIWTMKIKISHSIRICRYQLIYMPTKFVCGLKKNLKPQIQRMAMVKVCLFYIKSS